MAVFPLVLINGTVADANDVMSLFSEIYTDIDETNISQKTGSGKIVLQQSPTIKNIGNSDSLTIQNTGTGAGIQFAAAGANVKDLNGPAGVWWVDNEGDATFNSVNITGGGGFVTSVTAGDGTITIGGGPTTPTVKVTGGIFQPAGSYITTGTADATYLKLDTSNDPLTGDLACGTSDTVSASNNRVIRAADPVNDQDLMTKKFADINYAPIGGGASTVTAWARCSGGAVPVILEGNGFSSVTQSPAGGSHFILTFSAALATNTYAVLLQSEVVNLFGFTLSRTANDFQVWFDDAFGVHNLPDFSVLVMSL